MGEAHGTYQPMSAMFYLYVPDAMRLTGGRSLLGRNRCTNRRTSLTATAAAAVKDAFGNIWYVATHIKDVTP